MTLLLAALVIEAVALCLWPTVFMLSAPESASRLGDMFLHRYQPVAEVLWAITDRVNWVVPGALESWEHRIEFFFACVFVAFAAYALAAWRLTRWRMGEAALSGSRSMLRWVVVPLVIFQATLIWVPGSMTTDIFNYALYGEMPVLYDANPFVRTPSEFPESPLYDLIPLYWHDAPSVYGPLWVAVSTGVAGLLRSMPLADELLAYRLIANAAHLVNTLLIWSIARRLHPKRAPSAALAYGWNPLLLVDFALNGHNDALMLTLVLVAFLLACGRRHSAAGLAFGLSVATKYTSILVAPVLLLYGARRAGSANPAWVGRLLLRLSRIPFLARLPNAKPPSIAQVLRGSLLVIAPVVLLYLPWFQGIDTLGPLLYWASGPRLANFWPEPALISVTAWTSGLLGTSYEAAWYPILEGFKLIVKAVFAGYILIEAWRAQTLDDVLAASARIALVFLMLVNTWILPWYYAWPLAFCAALGWGSMTTRVCAGFTLTAMVIMYQRHWGHEVVAEWAGLFLVLPLALALAPRVAGWLQNQRTTRAGGLRRLPSDRPAVDSMPH
ncbi:MAG: hypothetical protein GEU73_02315 [Chloroflexi bacterium]|nr:hypothetical protein [Chloroflexota bacterium]